MPFSPGFSSHELRCRAAKWGDAVESWPRAYRKIGDTASLITTAADPPRKIGERGAINVDDRKALNPPTRSLRCLRGLFRNPRRRATTSERRIRTRNCRNQFEASTLMPASRAVARPTLDIISVACASTPVCSRNSPVDFLVTATAKIATSRVAVR